MVKKQQYISKIQHSKNNNWHIYDVQLISGMGWDYILSSAQYVIDKDFSRLDGVSRAENLATAEKSCTEAVNAAGGILADCRQTSLEGSLLAVAGLSKSLNIPLKISWVNQTKILRIFTLTNINDLIEPYVNALIERKLPVNGKKLQKKADSKPSDKERLFGAKIMLGLGGIWTAGGLFMASVLEGFMPFGIGWFVLSIGFMLWGTYILGESKKKKEPLLVEKPVTSPPKPEPKKPAPQPEKEKLWVVVNKSFPLLPFTTADGRIRLYKDSAAAQRYIDHKKEFPLNAMSLTPEQLERCKNIWVKFGIKSIDIYSDDEKFITDKTTDSNFIGDMVALLLLRIRQNTVRNGDKNFLAMDYDWLKKELETTPLLVPMTYDNDDETAMAKDTAIHMTAGASRLLSNMLKDENGQPRNPIPTFYGIKKLTGDRFGVIWNGDSVVYYGGMETSGEIRQENSSAATTEDGNRIMHCFFADNAKTKAHMLAVFTNMEDLRNMFPTKRVGMYTFSELTRLAQEGDGIIFDPGSASLCAEIDHTTIEKLI